MKRYIITLIIALGLVACSQDLKQYDTLTQVESFVIEKPDSALIVLEQIDISELSSKE
jgi:uncharacterized lipoprotein YmbA